MEWKSNIYRRRFNDIWLSRYPINKYSLNAAYADLKVSHYTACLQVQIDFERIKDKHAICLLVYSGREGGPIHFGLRMYFFWGWLHVIWLILQMQKKYKLSVHFFNDIVFFYLQLGKQKLKICNNMENKIKTLLENGSL